MAFVLLALLAWGSALHAQSVADGIAAVEAGRLDDAKRILSVAAQQHPDSFDANFYLGLAHYRAGEPAAAQPLLERAVRLSPGNAEAWKTLGIALMSMNNLAGSLPILEKACGLAPADEQACYYFARNQYALGHFEAAREPFEKALKSATKQTLPRVHRAMALNFDELGLSAEAEKHFVAAIQMNSRSTRPSEDPRVDYGAFLFHQGRTEEALRPLEQAVRDAPNSTRANAELGRVLLQLDKLDAAVKCLEKVVAAEPANWNARMLLGRAYLRLGKTAEGEREMQLGQEGWNASKNSFIQVEIL